MLCGALEWKLGDLVCRVISVTKHACASSIEVRVWLCGCVLVRCGLTRMPNKVMPSERQRDGSPAHWYRQQPRQSSPRNGSIHFEAVARDAYDRVNGREQALAAGSSKVVADSIARTCTLDVVYQRSFARLGLALIVFMPLVMMPLHGFMLANGLDDLMLAAYTLLAIAALLCSLLAPDDVTQLPKQVISVGVRAAYSALWLVTPVLSRNLDWSGYVTIPLGVLGLLVVRNPASCWFADVYVLAMILAPCASIALAYTIDLHDTTVLGNLSVADWRAHRADAFAFNDGYVVTEWRGRMAQWSHVEGGLSMSMRSEYGVAPVVPHRGCITNSSEFRGTMTSSCDVAMMVMYSSHWEDRSDGYNDIDDSVVGAQENSHFGLCSVSGHIGRRAFDSFGSSAVSGRGLCVYADPLYRAPRGTPPQAIEECRVLLSRHNLSPLSICNTQYFVLDHDEDHRRWSIFTLAVGSCGLVVSGVVAGLARPELSGRLRRYFSRGCQDARRGVPNDLL